MTENSFLSAKQIFSIGFKSVGKDVQISKHALFYNPGQVSIGNHSRIDDFAIISGACEVTIGSYVHISTGVTMLGTGKIIIGDFCSVSVKTSIFASTDDYSGQYMTNPMVPAEFTHVLPGLVVLEDHVIIGAHSVILPDTYCEKGAAFGAFSLLNATYPAAQIYAGIPAKKINKRRQTMFALEKQIADD